MKKKYLSKTEIIDMCLRLRVKYWTMLHKGCVNEDDILNRKEFIDDILLELTGPEMRKGKEND